MIDKALVLLRNEVSAYLRTKDTSLDDSRIILDNIGMLESSGGNNLQDHVIISLVNIEEEATLKNQAATRVSGSTIQYRTKPVYLNLYVLITCNYTGDGYTFALQRLSHIVKFLQRKRVFSYSGYDAAIPEDFDDPERLEMCFSADLHTLSFEQINYLWGSLGGRQVPFVMYKLRLVSLLDERTIRQSPAIEEIFTGMSKI